MSDELTRIKTLLEEHSRHSSERYEVIKSRLDRLDHAVHGNGSEGLKTRVDRLETRNRVVNWFAGTTTGAAILAVANWIVGGIK